MLQKQIERVRETYKDDYQHHHEGLCLVGNLEERVHERRICEVRTKEIEQSEGKRNANYRLEHHDIAREEARIPRGNEAIPVEFKVGHQRRPQGAVQLASRRSPTKRTHGRVAQKEAHVDGKLGANADDVGNVPLVSDVGLEATLLHLTQLVAKVVHTTAHGVNPHQQQRPVG
eukprot:459896-Prymnesium_polylepis.2